MVEATHLGKQSSYPQHYDPTVLVAVPRNLNRVQYGISNTDLPFIGFDVWHAYEFSFLTDKGSPVVGLLKIVYSCTNDFLVESKSLKLYLNSFNMDRFGSSKEDGIKKTTKIIRADLEELLKCDVDLTCFEHDSPSVSSDFSLYEIIEDFVDFDQLKCSEYQENPELLETAKQSGKIKWGSHILRSNCKITHQPDWGSIFLSMKGNTLPTPESFLKYIVSLRNENHFHEEICEMVFKRLIDIFKPEYLTISCQYTRRGGIDINPVRYLSDNNLPDNLINCNLKDKIAFRQ